MGSVLYSFPVVFLMFFDSLLYEDYTTYEAAEVLGLSKWRQFKTITVPSTEENFSFGYARGSYDGVYRLWRFTYTR